MKKKKSNPKPVQYYRQPIQELQGNINYDNNLSISPPKATPSCLTLVYECLDFYLRRSHQTEV